MKLINNIQYLEFKEAIACGIPEGTLKAALARKSSSWSFIDDPSDRRKVLIEFASLKDIYKQLVVAKFGEPAVYLSSQILKHHLNTNPVDVAFLNNYRFENGDALPAPVLKQYTEACRWLSFLTELTPKRIRSLGYNKVPDFYNAVTSILKKEEVKLPLSYDKLRLKIEDYKERGAACIVHGGRGKVSNNRKVTDELSESLLLELISHHNQFEDPFVAKKYNQWAKLNNYKPISDATVGRYRRLNNVLLAASREGNAVWRNSYDKVIHRVKPTAPLLLINSDDLDLDLYYQEITYNKQGHKKVNYLYRFKLMVVMDAFNNYPLGYAVGEAQTEDLVRAAYANAINHIRELTGNYYSWQQIVTDHWGIAKSNSKQPTSLQQWYESQAVFTPAKVGNARSKSIEAAFGRWHQVLKQYTNYAGHNITAVSKINPDAIKLNKKDFPLKEDGHNQIAEVIHRIRTEISDKTGTSLQQEWIDAFNANHARMLPLNTSRRLQLYGTVHPWKNELTNAGINITIDKRLYTFDVPEADYMRNVGKRMQVIYDPYNMSEILAITEDGRVQIVCPSFDFQKMAIADMVPGDRAKINVLIDQKDRMGQHVLDTQAQRRELLQRKGIDANSMLQAGYISKQTSQIADNSYRQRQLQQPDAFDMDSNNEQNNNENTPDLWDL